jgi:hypothetical protein
MKNKFNMYLAGALMCAAALFTVIACEKDEEKTKPGKAVITVVDETDNKCAEAEPFVILGVTAENATSYKWYKNGTALSGTGTGEALTVTESGTYTAAGVNDQGEGAVSDAKTVTIIDCTPGVPVISGDDTNPCPEVTVELTVEAIPNATSYKWYKDDEVIPGETSQTLTVTEDGSYAVAGVNDNQVEGTRSDPKVVTITTCAAPIPDAAGEIDGDNANTCPETTVTLTIGEIENATSYQWYRGETKLDGETSQTLTVTQNGNYSVEGVNDDLEPGTRSEGHQVTITSCVPAKPNVPQGTGGATTNNCAQQQSTLQIYTNFIDGANTVTWYELGDGGSSVSVQSLTKEEEGYLHYDVPTSGTYVVQGSNDWHVGPVSDPIVVDITECTPENMPPQGTPIIINGYGEAINGTVARHCVTNKTILLAIDNLISEPVAGGVPITGALSYTWYRYSDPSTPVAVSTMLASSGYYGTQLKLTEGGTYTVVARNDIDDGEESEPVVVEWITCPPAAREIKGDATGCNGKTVTLEVIHTWTEASAGNYYWYKDGEKVGETTREWTYDVTTTGTYKMAAYDAEGVGAFSNEITVTFRECEGGGDGPEITTVVYDDFADFLNPATFNVYDRTGLNPGLANNNNYSVTVKKSAIAGFGDPPVIITGLGGTTYASGEITGYFNVANQTITIYGGSDYPLEYEGTTWVSGSSADNAANITATVKKVDGKVYIYLPAVAINPVISVSYAIWSQGNEFADWVATGVDATNYHGTGTATVLVQQQ